MVDKIGHLFIVDIEFDHKNATEKEISFNKISTPICEKKKVLSGNGRSAFQLLNAVRLNDKSTINLYKTTAKTHITMDEKIAIPLYAGHLHLLITRCG